MKVTEGKPTDFIPDSRNANRGTQRGQKMIQDSLREDGVGRGIVVDKNGNVVAGNKTLENAVDVGIDKVIVVETTGQELVVTKRVDWDLYEDESPRRYAWRDNQSSLVSIDFDPEMLAEEIAQGVDFSGIFTEDEQAGLLAELGGDKPPEDTGPQIDKAEELREKWGVELGQMWKLGEHRVICGDCTDKAVVERVMVGELSDLVLTDPPYAVNYGSKNRALNSIGPSNRIQSDIKNDTLSVEDTAKYIWGPAFKNSFDNSRNGAVIYSFSPQGGDQMMMMMMMMMMRAEWNKRLHQLIWRKNSPTFSMGRLDYQYQHEPILYTWKGTNHSYYGDVGRSVIDCDRPKSSDSHPTMKPLELIEILMKNSSKINELIIDPFLGSGTTLIACQNLNRKCRGIEIDPGYVAVTLERFQTTFGIEPELVSNA